MNGWPQVDRWSEQLGRLADLSGSQSATLSALQGLLPLAVAGLIDVVRCEGWPERLCRLERLRQRWAAEGRDSWSEALLHRCRPGESRREFADLAEVLAVMAFAPGGVRAFGLHWDESGEG